MKKILPILLLGYTNIVSANSAIIYPDQLQFESLGAGICSSDNRLITQSEALVYRSDIVKKMGKWQIVGLAGGWVIMGSGYAGEIKQGTASNSWCYPKNPLNEIPSLSALKIAPGSQSQIEWNLVNKKEQFIKPLSYLAYYMGFAWLSGNRSNYIGEDMEVTKSEAGWKIQGYNGGSCSGYRCEEKSSILVSNFEYIMDTGSYKITGDIVSADKKLIRTLTVPVVNNTSVEQISVVTIEYDASTNWSKTNDYSISESVTLSNTWKSPSVTGGSDTSLSVTISANQAWGKSNGGSQGERVAVQARTNIPANTSLNAKVDLFKSSISYPYEFNADITYDVTISGFMRWGGNALLSHPDDRPTGNANFAIGRWAGQEKSIQYQWVHRYIPGENKKWDWPWMIEQTSLSTMQYELSNILRPKKTTLTGHFFAESQFAGNVYFGDETSLPSNQRSKRSVASIEQSNAENLKKDLENAGLKNVVVKIEMIDL
ncbi:aerolysin family beta-barrel pore-forming toxin [Pseudoalteromonas arctica]|uniref:Aerolysin family beta-barrel pore-forming toxin n=1 Tax=Pseudoalteromonas arctica TaxID=394751 RepID=A0A7Y0DQF8_9GAMM|nr:aerolysin family beta-barrel pore-forming toxin [Pseudoalteromonas arctica]NMM39750.1 aerolysin family beta-barrel pore-forming toxin [Pseudoalteromonas arctica]